MEDHLAGEKMTLQGYAADHAIRLSSSNATEEATHSLKP